MGKTKPTECFEREYSQSLSIRRNYRKKLIQSVARQIYRISMEEKISLQKLSEMANISELTLNQWIVGKGNLHLDNLCKICLRFNKRLIISIKDIDDL
ncbi:MAG: helix-turn-helix transcriptional regulator [Alphaproteobacteria bacterium]|nr:helix-turn-helix transcriptional regulator [Alphaproteobacteria bacterium]